VRTTLIPSWLLGQIASWVTGMEVSVATRHGVVCRAGKQSMTRVNETGMHGIMIAGGSCRCESVRRPRTGPTTRPILRLGLAFHVSIFPGRYATGIILFCIPTNLILVSRRFVLPMVSTGYTADAGFHGSEAARNPVVRSRDRAMPGRKNSSVALQLKTEV
jgi:hypothetical protein